MAEVICTGGSLEVDVPPEVGTDPIGSSVPAEILLLPLDLYQVDTSFESEAAQAIALLSGEFLGLLGGEILETMEVLPVFSEETATLLMVPLMPGMAPAIAVVPTGSTPAILELPPLVPETVGVVPLRVSPTFETVIDAPIVAEVSLAAWIGPEDAEIMPAPTPETGVIPHLLLLDGSALVLDDGETQLALMEAA